MIVSFVVGSSFCISKGKRKNGKGSRYKKFHTKTDGTGLVTQ